MVEITISVSKLYGGCEFQKKIVHLLFTIAAQGQIS